MSLSPTGRTKGFPRRGYYAGEGNPTLDRRPEWPQAVIVGRNKMMYSFTYLCTRASPCLEIIDL
eukprot:9081995-Heterocapsa_arctica.AAC.1